ncbi:MAG: hypothetical protein ACI9WV_000260, partial [Patiriisocius sp.]
MKKFLSVFLLFTVLSVFSQTEDTPIVWESSINQISETEYDVIFTATLLKEWHLYSQENPEGASQPLQILIPEGKNGYQLIGKAQESETQKEYSEVWE